MGYLYVYDPWPTAVDTMGLCGPLTPTKATCTQEKNGDFSLEINHPIDAAGKWAYLAEDNIIKADVPLPTVPEFYAPDAAALVTTIYAATVKDVSHQMRGVYPAAWDGPVRMFTLPIGTAVYVCVTSNGQSFGGYCRIRWPGGCGWIDQNALTISASSITISNTPTALEQYIPSPTARMQLFRIYKVEKGDTSVTAYARHLFYDNLGTFVDYAAATVSCVSLVAALKENKSYYLDEFYGNAKSTITSTAEVKGWTRAGYCEAFLSPSDGVLTYWDAMLIREFGDVVLLPNTARDRGFTIDYGANMLGVKYSIDLSDVASAVYPLGQTSKGKVLTVAPDTYTIDGTDGIYGPIVRSPDMYDGVYATEHTRVIDYGSKIKATSTTTSAVLAARIKLIKAALREFSDNHIDDPAITVSVQFLMLGDTAEYAQYKDLQRLFLCDMITVRHGKLGINVSVQVNKTEWDCLTGRYISVDLGSPKLDYARTRLATWQVPRLDTIAATLDTFDARITSLGG